MFLGKHRLRLANYISKLVVWWKPKMIPRSLRSFCTSRFDWKPIIKVQFLTKDLESTFPVNKWIWKTSKMDLATKFLPPDWLRYHVRLVARICLLPFAAPQMTRLYRNRRKEFENHDFKPKHQKILEKSLKIIFLLSFLGARRQGGSL